MHFGTHETVNAFRMGFFFEFLSSYCVLPLGTHCDEVLGQNLYIQEIQLSTGATQWQWFRKKLQVFSWFCEVRLVDCLYVALR